MISTNFFPKEPVPPVTRTDCSAQFIPSASSQPFAKRLMPFFLFVDSFDQRTRVMSCTQLVSQVLPSSGESACSQWPDVGVMLDQRKRARTRFPLTVSSP